MTFRRSKSMDAGSTSCKPSSLGLRRTNTLDSQTSITSVGSSTSIHASSGNKLKKLEELAEAFQVEMQQQQLVQDQTACMKTIPKAFTGKDVVNVLEKLLNSGSTEGATVTREQALEKGMEIMTSFSFFKHASSADKPLIDSERELFRFDHNLPSQVRKVKNLHSSPWAKVRLLEQHIECKDLWYFPRVYPNCFVAKEAVDVMMELKLVRSRREAVHLMKRLNQKVFCCEHVTQEHEFSDSYLFFEFIPAHERMPEPRKRLPSPKRTTKKRTVTKKDADSRGSSSLNRPTITSEEELKKVNQRRAEGIKSRLANYKQERIMVKQKSCSNVVSNVAA